MTAHDLEKITDGRNQPREQRKRRLSAKESRFIDYYCNPKLETFRNGPKAASAAGYSETSASSQAKKLLERPRVIDAIALRLRAAANVVGLDMADFVARALEQADAWTIEVDGKRQAKAETYATRDGQLYTRDARPSSAEVKALELAGKATGHISEGTSGAGVQVNTFVVALPDKASNPGQWLNNYKTGTYGRSLTDDSTTTYEEDPGGA